MPRGGNQSSCDFSNLLMFASTALLFSFTGLLYRRAGGFAIILFVLGGGALAAIYYLDIHREEGTPGYLMRGLIQATIGINKFIAWPGRNAVVVGVVLSLYMRVIAPRFAWQGLCADTAGDRVDTEGNSCDYYEANLGLQCSGVRDNGTWFTAGTNCCNCGGGEFYLVRWILAQLLVIGITIAWVYAVTKRDMRDNVLAELDNQRELSEIPRPVEEASPGVATTPTTGTRPATVPTVVVTPARPAGGGIVLGPGAAQAAGRQGNTITPAAGSTANCVICMTNRSDHAILPCGHMCICEGCVPQLARESGRCPLCRVQAQGAARIYVS